MVERGFVQCLASSLYCYINESHKSQISRASMPQLAGREPISFLEPCVFDISLGSPPRSACNQAPFPTPLDLDAIVFHRATLAPALHQRSRDDQPYDPRWPGLIATAWKNGNDQQTADCRFILDGDFIDVFKNGFCAAGRYSWPTSPGPNRRCRNWKTAGGADTHPGQRPGLRRGR